MQKYRTEFTGHPNLLSYSNNVTRQVTFVLAGVVLQSTVEVNDILYEKQITIL